MYLVLPEDVSGSTVTVIVQFRCCDACSSAKYSWVTCSSHDMHTDLNVLQTMATNACETIGSSVAQALAIYSWGSREPCT